MKQGCYSTEKEVCDGPVVTCDIDDAHISMIESPSQRNPRSSSVRAASSAICNQAASEPLLSSRQDRELQTRALRLTLAPILTLTLTVAGNTIRAANSNHRRRVQVKRHHGSDHNFHPDHNRTRSTARGLVMGLGLAYHLFTYPHASKLTLTSPYPTTGRRDEWRPEVHSNYKG